MIGGIGAGIFKGYDDAPQFRRPSFDVGPPHPNPDRAGAVRKPLIARFSRIFIRELKSWFLSIRSVFPPLVLNIPQSFLVS